MMYSLIKSKLFIAVSIVTILLPVAPSFAGQELADDAALDRAEYQSLKRYSQLDSADKVAESNLRVQQVVQTALTFSPATREIMAGAQAAGLDVLAAKGAKLPQVTLTGQSIVTEGDLALASKNRGSPGVTVSATYTVYDWGRLDAAVKGRLETQLTLYARQSQVVRIVSLDAIGACLELTKARAILSSNLDYTAKIRDLVARLYKVVESDPGRAGQLVQTRSRMLQADSSIESARTKVQEAKYRIDRVLGPNQYHQCQDLGASLLSVPELSTVTGAIPQHPQIRIVESDYRQQLSAVDQLAATRKPQVAVQASHAPVSIGFTQDYAQTLSLTVTAPLYDGNTLKSTERASLERANAALERKEDVTRQLTDEIKQRHSQATRNLARAKEYVSLLEINQKVRDDFFMEWSALGRRSLFELLSIEQEQFTLNTGYFTALYDGMQGVAYLKVNSGALNLDTITSK
jgi:adhesin transport system outer membrane protein